MEEKVTETKEVKKADKPEISNSKQKRLDREKKQKAEKRNAAIGNAIWIGIGIIIIACIIAFIVVKVVEASKQITASSDYSAELEDNGFIKDIKAGDYITLFDYKNIEVPYSEIAYTDEQMNEDIESALDAHKVLDTETTDAIEDGDTVNIDYVGSIDGEEFDGGNSNGEGSDLTIGSGTFVDDFEQQLIGYKVGEVANVNVDFPEDYSSADLAGKNADFVVTINGIYEEPELTDEFIQENYGDDASTVDEYKQYLKNTAEEDNLDNYLEEYIKNNTVVNKYPKAYLKNLKATTKYDDEESFNYINQMYMQYYGTSYSSVEEYKGMTEEEYLDDIDTRAKESCLVDLADQAILESEGITISPDEVKESGIETYGSEDSYNSVVEQYGVGYMAKEMIPDKVLEILKDNVTIKQ